MTALPNTDSTSLKISDCDLFALYIPCTLPFFSLLLFSITLWPYPDYRRSPIVHYTILFLVHIPLSPSVLIPCALILVRRILAADLDRLFRYL